MRKPILALTLALTAALAHADVLQLRVEGLNCALCSQQMRAALLKAAQASAIEPRLECGVIFLETRQTPAAAEAALGWTLTSHGFNLKGVERSALTLAEAKALAC